MDTQYLYKLSKQPDLFTHEAAQALQTAAMEIDLLRKSLRDATVETDTVKAHLIVAKNRVDKYENDIVELQRVAADGYYNASKADLTAAQKALGDLHKRFGIMPGMSTGTLGGDLRAQSERLLRYCTDEALISAAGIKMKLQDITRALP